MLVRISIRRLRHGFVFGSVAWMVCGSGWAGEKIRFTDQPEQSKPPGRGLPEDFSRGFDLRPSAPSAAEGANLPPPTSSKARDPKVEELIDQKKNWIFSTPSRANSDAALKQMFNVREYKFDEVGGDKRSRSVVDRYFDREREARDEVSTKLNSKNKDQERLGGTEGSNENVNIGGLPLEQSPTSSTSAITDLVPATSGRRPFEAGSPLSAAPGDLLPRNFNSTDVFGFPRQNPGSGTSPLSGQEQRLQDFRRILGASPIGSGSGRDPVNLQKDGPRPAAISGGAAAGLSGGLDGGLTGAGAAVSPISGGRSPISDALNPRFPGGSSLAPSISPPSSPSFIQPRPAMLEIPRRKF